MRGTIKNAVMAKKEAGKLSKKFFTRSFHLFSYRGFFFIFPILVPGASKQSIKRSNLEFDPDCELTDIEVEPYIQVDIFSPAYLVVTMNFLACLIQPLSYSALHRFRRWLRCWFWSKTSGSWWKAWFRCNIERKYSTDSCPSFFPSSSMKVGDEKLND